jgi:two-component system OmpR family response regulator
MAEAQPDRVTMRLLVIEDDRDAADYLVKAFREVGHVADAATVVVD